MKRVCATILAGILCLSVLAGCGSSDEESSNSEASDDTVSESPEITDTSTLNIGTQLEWTDMNPYATYTGGAESQYRNVFEYVFDRVDGELVPLIGKEFTEIDAKTYEVTIYDNVYDSAGNHITADDVVFSYMECKNQFSMYVGFLTDYAETIDDYTFRIVAASDRKGLVELILSSVPIVSQAAYEASEDNMSSDPVGTGRYELKEYVAGSSTEYTLRDDYWQDEDKTALYSQANIENIKYVYITEPAQLTIALETGTVDAIHRLPATETYHFEDGGDYEGMFDFNTIDYNVVVGLNMNASDKSPLADKTLRQAILYAIDNEAILDNAYSGYGGVAKTYGSAYANDYLDQWESEDYYDYDLEKAKELMAQTGYAEGELTLRLLTNNNEAPAELEQIIQTCLMQIGINVEILSYDVALYTAYQENLDEWDMMVGIHTAPDYVTSMWDACFNATRHDGASLGGYADDEMQELLMTAISAETSDEETMQEFHEYAKEAASNYGLIYQQYFTVSNSNLEIQCDDMGYVVAGASSFK